MIDPLGVAWIGLVGFLAVIGLIAFTIAHVTHRRDRDSEERILSDAASGGDPKLVEAVGDATAKIAEARGRAAPKWRRFEGSNVLPRSRQ